MVDVMGVEGEGARVSLGIRNENDVINLISRGWIERGAAVNIALDVPDIQAEMTSRRYTHEEVLNALPSSKKKAEAKAPASSCMVGVTRFELVTSSVSGKRSPPELNARM